MRFPLLLPSCLIFLFYLAALPAAHVSMFADPDSYWHLATGDLIRVLGALPEYDGWSLSAGQKHWYITSWGWDAAASFVYARLGWHGLVMMNSITIAATLAVLFAGCMQRSREGFSAFFATLLAAACLLDVSLRPHQAGLLCIALLMLLLNAVAERRLAPRWLLAVPPFMLVWVNLYAGFIIGLFLFGLFALDALLRRERLQYYILAGALSLAACCLNPAGIGLFRDLLAVGGDTSRQLIGEWRSLSFSAADIPALTYLALFAARVIARPRAFGRREYAMALIWFALGIMSIRHLRIFAIVSAPLLAAAMTSHGKPAAWMSGIHACGTRLLESPKAARLALAASIAASMLMLSPLSENLYRTRNFNPLPDMSAELDWLEKNRPQARLLNSYNLGGPLIFLTHGRIPVFMDGRVGTAYPLSVIRDYIRFHNAEPGWTDIFDRYRLDGAIVLSSDREFIWRFKGMDGWRTAFAGPAATIFLRR